jgi:hypothetical protein
MEKLKFKQDINQPASISEDFFYMISGGGWLNPEKYLEEEDAKRAVDTAREVVSRGDDESAEGKRKRVKISEVAEEANPVVEEAAPIAEVSAEVDAAAPSEEEPAA